MSNCNKTAEAEEERAFKKEFPDLWFKMNRWKEQDKEEAEAQLKEKRRKLEGLGVSQREMGRKMMQLIIEQYGWKWDRGEEKGGKDVYDGRRGRIDVCNNARQSTGIGCIFA